MCISLVVEDFFRAIEEGDLNVLHHMLRHYERKFAVNQADETGYGALHYAASAGQAEVGSCSWCYAMQINLTFLLNRLPVFFLSSVRT